MLVTEVLELLIAKSPSVYTSESYKVSSSKFQEAIKSLADPLLPIRAYGLTILKTMVLCKDPIAKDKMELILNIFLEQLEDSDSFIYLNAVKGLSALTDVYPSFSLSRILERYLDIEGYTMDYRLRIGECILQTIQRSGQSFSKIGKPILEAISKVLRDDQKEIRSSAMSCLAMISETDPLSLLPYLYQIMDYFTNLLIFEKSVETRRGALFNFCSLIHGLGTSIFTSIPKDIIEQLQTRLEHVAETDHDILTRSHAQIAIAEMESIIAEYLKI